MKSRILSHRTTVAMLAAGCLFAAASAQADPGTLLPLDEKGSWVKFTGVSFLHDFHGEAKDFSGNATWEPQSAPPLQHATLRFPTAKLTTFQKDRDKKMYEWLKVTQKTLAAFSLDNVKPTSGDYKNADPQHPAHFAVQGSFTLNGVKQPLNGSADGWRDKNHVVVSGKTTIDTLKFALPQIHEMFMTVGTNVEVTYQFTFLLPPEYSSK